MRYKPDERFRSTAPFYARYRPGYPAAFFEHLVTRFGLDETQRVLDLGSGTGQIALHLAPYVARVLAVDPEPSMLTEGGRIAEERDVHNIDWLVGDSYRLAELDLPGLTLVTMGASFHWMDRAGVLRDLDHHMLPGGAVVVASGGAPADRTPPPWTDTVAAVRERYLGPARRAGSGTYHHPEEGHAEVLRRSPFSEVETVEWNWILERDLDSVVGLQFSFSYSAPVLFGSEERRAAFESELRDALTGQFTKRVLRERIRTEALIATRP